MRKNKLVPVEPTPEMVKVGQDAANGMLSESLVIEVFEDMLGEYKAMLAAAPDHIADAGKMVSRQQIRAVFLRNGFTIKPGCDDLREYVYKAAFELLELATPDVQGEPVAHTFYILHDATEGQKYIKKDVDDGCLAIFEREEDAQRVKRRHPGTEYKRVDYYTTPQPAEQQPAPDVAALVEALEEIAKWTERWTAPDHPITTVARKALAAHRKGAQP